MDKTLLIFDFDGTIANTMEVAVEIINGLGEEFGYPSVDAQELVELRHKSIPELMKLSGLSWLQLPLFIKRARDRFRDQIDEVSPIEGMPDVLQVLQERGYRMGILTSNTRDSVETFLQAYGLSLFEFIQAPDSIFGKSKSLKDLKKALRLKKKDMVMIGDEARDLEAAYKARIDAVGVCWGFNSRQLLQAHKPQALIDHPRELLDLFPVKDPLAWD